MTQLQSFDQPELPPPGMTENFCLPEGYKAREEPSYYLDETSNLIHQPSVYAFAAYLAQRARLRYVIDIGCGQGHAVSRHFRAEQVVGIDYGQNLEIAAAKMPGGSFIEQDLEKPFTLPEEIVRQAVIVCSDVLEHLKDPLPLVRSLTRLHQVAPYVLVSTPDRERARGVSHMGPPCNVAHIREWTLGELGRLFAREGLQTPYLGYTRNTDRHHWKSTSLLLGGCHAALAPSPNAAPNILAIVSCYNDVDVILACYAHLRAQGIKAYFIDNWSKDGTFEMVQSLHRQDPSSCVGVERYPASGPLDHYDWHGILRRKEAIAAQANFDWFIHHDSDELRYGPCANWTMSETIARIDALGYNAVDHTVIDFRPTDDSYRANHALAEQFTHFEFGRQSYHFIQTKAWKKQAQRVELTRSGGHEAEFLGRKVYPLKFLLAHYSLRSPQLAARKLLVDRAPRIGKEKAQFGWHVHIGERLAEAHTTKFLWDPHALQPYNPSQFPAEFMVERLSGIDLAETRPARSN